MDALMVGAGEYTAGYVRTDSNEAASDKPAGVVAITLMDLRRLGKINRLVICDRDGQRMPAVRETLRTKIGDVYRDMDVTVETFPEDSVEFKETAYLDAMASMRKGDVVTIFTPDDTHFTIAMAAIERGLHVLLGKPAVKTISHHQQLIEAAKKHGVLVAAEYHKRFDPIYSDAHDRIATIGPFSFYSSVMTQGKRQLHTFAGWAGKSSDISYYLNAHHIDFLCWSIAAQARPVAVSAAASTGAADRELAWAREKFARHQIRVKGEGDGEGGEGSAQQGERKSVEDTITLLVHWETSTGSRATSVHMASWITPPADCHTQQYWHYMSHSAELRADQSHRGFNGCTDAKGFATLNPLYMKYTPDSNGRFAGQQGYGYRSISEFVGAAHQVNEGSRSPESFTDEGILATIDSLPALYTTAILEGGRKSLDSGGSLIEVSLS